MVTSEPSGLLEVIGKGNKQCDQCIDALHAHWRDRGWHVQGVERRGATKIVGVRASLGER
ncbi:hypothetical protein IHE33_13725 (plasmid) [Mycetohabitans endofungorum]|uniref:Uncharacterized protein n=1 Tax=Mycetohabitans endofungorum TaxID=417203 RepID=A0A2P5K7Y6_9BURK|nr:hypothetical protein B0O95_11434 [Mycetohabitans endofungorum]